MTKQMVIFEQATGKVDPLRGVLTVSALDFEAFIPPEGFGKMLAQSLIRDAACVAVAFDDQGEPVQVEITPPVDVELLRAQAINHIDYLVGKWRSRIITSVPGQEATYLEKKREAMDYTSRIADGQTITEGMYPMLEAEIGITGETLADVAGTVKAKAEQWSSLSARFERERLKAKQDIAAALSANEVEEILATFGGLQIT